jgi:hypothetical protein
MGMRIVPPGTAVDQTGNPTGTAQVAELAAAPVSATAAANTAVAITVTGVAGQSIRLEHLSASYSAAPAGGTLTVVVNGVTIWQADITAAGPALPPLPPGGLLCQAGQNAVITLTAAGAAVVGRVNVATTTR